MTLVYLGSADPSSIYLGGRAEPDFYVGSRQLWPEIAAGTVYNFDDMNTIGAATISPDGFVFESGPSYGFQEARGAMALYGKVYLEYTLTKFTGGVIGVGVGNGSCIREYAPWWASIACLVNDISTRRLFLGNQRVDYTLSDIVEGDVIGMAYDSELNEISFRVNDNPWFGPFRMAEFRASLAGAPVVPLVYADIAPETVTITMNTGQSPFVYTAPDGFGPPDEANRPAKPSDFRFRNADRSNDIAILNDGRTITATWGYADAFIGAHSIGELSDKTYVEFTIDTYVAGMGFGLSTYDIANYYAASPAIWAKPHTTTGSVQTWGLYLADGQKLMDMGDIDQVLETGSVVSMAFDIAKGDRFNRGMGSFRLRVNDSDWVTGPIKLLIDSLCPLAVIPIDPGKVTLNAGHAPFAYAPPPAYHGPEAT